MKTRFPSLTAALLLAPLTFLAVPGVAQSSATNGPQRWASASSDGAGFAASTSTNAGPEGSAPAAMPPAAASTRGVGSPAPAVVYGSRPFSRVSIGGSISLSGAGAEISTNLVPHLNLRLTGDYLGFGVNNLSEQGFNVDAKLHLASARASVDYYPFHKGFRLSPGVMFYNQNHAVATVAVPGGSSFVVDDQTYYSASGSQAVYGSGRVRLGSSSPVFTATTGWGNTIPRAGRHFSFPFEIGAAFQQAPTIGFNLSGVACYDQAHLYCTDISDTSNPIAVQIQQGVKNEISKYQKDIEPLKTYPLVSFGVAYSFGSGRMSTVR